jgi:hypothetical protein
MSRTAKLLLRQLLFVAASSAAGCGAPQPTSRRPPIYFAPTGTVAASLSGESSGDAAPKVDSPVSAASCPNAKGQLFAATAPWNQAVTGAAVASDSGVVIQYMDEHHHSNQRFRTDFSFVLLEADASEPLRPFVPTQDHYLPDCDTYPMPVPVGGRIEGEVAFECVHDGDCHLLVHVPESCQLYEMYRANIKDGVFSGGCLVRWDTRMSYGDSGRGFDCTSADASGLPIAPLLFSPTDVASGRINHAIRLILPNALIRQHVYVPPATHSSRPTSGPEGAPPYGARFRLKASFDLSRFTSGALVVAKALQEYGMIIVDGGNVSFTTLSDQESLLKWDEVGFNARSLDSLRWTDFEMVAPNNPPRYWKGGCESPVMAVPGSGQP